MTRIFREHHCASGFTVYDRLAFGRDTLHHLESSVA